MQLKRTAYITVTEAKEALVNHFLEQFKDLAHVRGLIESGELSSSVPDFSKLSNREIAEMYAELCLGEQLLRSEFPPIQVVMVDLGDDEFSFAARLEQCYPAVKEANHES